MKKTKLLATVLAIMMVAGIFAACGDGGTQAPADSGTTDTPAASTDDGGDVDAPPETEPSTSTGDGKTDFIISICGINLEDGMNVDTKLPAEGFNTYAANQLKEAFPDLNITFNAVPWDNASGKMQTILMSNGTDLFTQGGAFIPEYYKEGLSQSLNPFLDKDTEFFYEDNFPAVFKQSLNCTDYSGEELLTLPWQVGYRSIIYDTQLFDDWGVEYLSEYPTPEEILEKASQMTGTNPVSGAQNYGAWISGNSLNMSYLIPVSEAFDAKEVSGNYDDPANLEWSLNSDGYVKTVQWAVDIAQYVPAAAATGQGYEQMGTVNNDIAIIIDRNGGQIMGEFYRNGDESIIDRFECTMHMGKNGGNWTPVDGMGMAKYLEGADADTAWELLKYMTGEETTRWYYENHGPYAPPHLVGAELFHEKDKYLRMNARIIQEATHPGYEINPFYGSNMQPTLASLISRAIAGETVDVQGEMDALQEKAIAWSASR